LPGSVEVVPSECGREHTIPQRAEINQNPAIPPAVFKVSDNLLSSPIFKARKNKNPASFVPQAHTAPEENFTLKISDESKVGRAAIENAPVPIRSRCRCDPVARDTTNPSRLARRMALEDWTKGALSNIVGIMFILVDDDAPPLGVRLVVGERTVG